MCHRMTKTWPPHVHGAAGAGLNKCIWNKWISSTRSPWRPQEDDPLKTSYAASCCLVFCPAWPSPNFQVPTTESAMDTYMHDYLHLLSAGDKLGWETVKLTLTSTWLQIFCLHLQGQNNIHVLACYMKTTSIWMIWWYGHAALVHSPCYPKTNQTCSNTDEGKLS